MERTELPIAVFDSGLGGISVLRALVQRLPGEDFLYFGDSANAPYGVRPVAEVRRLTQDVIGRLYDRGIKAAVIACNTATSAAIGPLRAAFPDIPVIGIEPALKPAVAHHRRVLVLATPLTLREEKFVALMHQCAGCAEIVPLPCPELVEFVERGELDSPALTAYLARQLGPYAGRVDAAVLGCTHFPFARRAIRAALGGNVQRIAAAGDGGLGEVGQGDTADLLTGDVDDHGEGAALVFGQREAQRGDDGQQHDRQRHNEHKRDGDGQSFLLHVTFSSPKFCSKLPMSNSTVPGAARNH